MVHNLRSRNVCGTSERRKVNVPLARSVFETPLSEIRTQEESGDVIISSLDLSTNEQTTTDVSGITDWMPVSPLTQQSSVSIDERGNLNVGDQANVLTSTRIETTKPSNKSRIFTTTNNKSSSFSFICNLQSVIDETIFKNTYNNHKGASLHAIRKGIQEFGYNPKKNKNQTRLYVRECLENGKFLQKSGHGANGSFRLKNTIHSNFIRAHKDNKIHKIRNVNATAACLKRFKRHDLEITMALQTNTLTFTKTNGHSTLRNLDSN